jgi:sporulation protein YlmC with PRC-barrel domain
MKFTRLAVPSIVLLAGATLVSACESGRSIPAGTTYRSEAPAGTTMASRSFATMRASDLIGKSVYNRAGERIGEIDEVVTNRSSRATAAVVGVGGFLGVGERKVTVPLSQLQMQGDRIVAPTLMKEDLQRATVYQERDWDRYDRARTLSP